MWIKLKSAWNSHPAGEQINLEDETKAKSLVELDMAEACEDPTGAIANEEIEKAFAGFEARFESVATKAADLALKGVQTVVDRRVPAIVRDDTDGGRKTFGDFLKAIYNRDNERVYSVYKTCALAHDGRELKTKAALAELGGTTGGYLVPTDYHAQLMQVALEKTFIRQRATVIPVSGRSVLIPALDQSQSPPTGSSAFLGGVVMNWTEEAAALTETEPTVRQIELAVKKLAGYTVTSNELLADSAIALETLLMQIFGKALAWTEEYVFLNGNGAGKPLGILNSKAVINVSRNAANHVKYVDLATMMQKMLPESLERAVFVASISVMSELLTMVDPAGRYVWVPNANPEMGPAGLKPPGSIFGRPILFTEKVPILGSTGDIGLYDFSHYLIGDRQGIEIMANPYTKFTNDQMMWRVTRRLGGQPWLDKAFTLADGTTTVSPFVLLQ